MKKTLLLSAALVIAASGFSQGNRSTRTFKPVLHQRDQQAVDVMITPAGNPNQATAKVIPHSYVNATCSAPIVTKAPNVLTVSGGSSNNCFTYNADLNAVSWVCRSGAWTFPGSSSGTIKAVWMKVSGTTWDSMVIYKDSTSASSGGRYPGGALLNPKGNTNVANATWLCAGPHVTSAFDGVYYNGRKATGSYQTTYPANKKNTLLIPGAGSAVFGNIENSTVQTPALDVDFQAVGTTKAFVTGPLGNPAYTTANGLHMKGAVIVKASTATGSLVWSVDSIMPPFYTDGIVATGTGYQNNGDARIAFGPDSLTGYMVFSGALTATAGNSSDSMYAPIVYKTTNGGTTWTPVLAGYGWMENHPECMKNVCSGTIATNFRPKKATHYSFNDDHGSDLVVDANGWLHYVSTVGDMFKNGALKDSMDYQYNSYQYDYVNHHPLIWDFMTDGSCWKTMYIDSILTSHMGIDPTKDTTALNNQWYYSPNSNYMGYGANINVSRSVDGTKIFYGWSDSDPLSTGNSYNVQPDLFLKGYDVSSKMISPTKNVTNGLLLCYFPRLSDISYYDNTQSAYVVPTMVTNGTKLLTTPTTAWDGISPVDFHYINCGTFNTASFSTSPTIHTGMGATACAVGIKTNNAFVNSVNNYPNPFSTTTNVVVNLNDGKALDLKVYDAVGKLVYSKQMNGTIGENTFVVDAANLNAGVYYYTITAGYDRVTKKMVIQK
jgi:hypothetical protein